MEPQEQKKEEPIFRVPPTANQPHQKSWLAAHGLFLAVLVLVVGIASAATFYYWQSTNKQIPVFESPKHIEKPTPTPETVFCGGIAGLPCPTEGYTCVPEGNYPDAGTNCVKNPPQTINLESGTLTGHANIGPNCPVEQPGKPCPASAEAYTSRSVLVYKSDGKTLVKSQNFDKNGNYSIDLNPGTYVVKTATGINGFSTDTVNIQKGKTTTLNFDIDTGIR